MELAYEFLEELVNKVLGNKNLDKDTQNYAEKCRSQIESAKLVDAAISKAAKHIDNCRYEEATVELDNARRISFGAVWSGYLNSEIIRMETMMHFMREETPLQRFVAEATSDKDPPYDLSS